MTNYRTSRRDFIRSAVGAAALFGRAGLLSAQTASAPDYKALVCVFLFGGNDANNLLVPNETATYTDYQKIRQNLAIPRDTLLSIFDAPTNLHYGLHPSLSALAPLYDQKRLALMTNTGPLVKRIPAGSNGRPDLTAVPLPSNLYSHSDQQTEWQNASPAASMSTGWSGRLVDRVAATASFPPAIGIGSGSLQIAGGIQAPTVIGDAFTVLGSDQRNAASDARASALQQMLRLPNGATLIQAAQSSFRSALDIANQVDKLLTDASDLPVSFPATDLGQQLQQVARIVRVQSSLGANRQIFFCSQGGYDTHSAQLGQQAQLLTELSDALFAFDQNMGQLGYGDKVTAFTESEFSRTLQPNGNAGTDHAWGTHTLIVGGAVKGGRLYGKFPALALQGPDDSGDRGDWVPTTSSDQYAGALAKWFGLQPEDYDYVFPNLKSFDYELPPFL